MKRCALLAMVLGMAGSASAAVVDINFDSLDASGGALSGAAVTNYLAGYGITASNLTPGGDLYIANSTSWSYVATPSAPNIFTMWGPTPNGNSFTLNFSTDIENFSFTRSGFIGANSPSGNVLGPWTAIAYDAANNALGQVGEPLIASYGDISMQTFTLAYSGIDHIIFSANALGWAGQQMPLMDNFRFNTLERVPEPATLALFGTGLAAFGWARRRGQSK